MCGVLWPDASFAVKAAAVLFGICQASGAFARADAAPALRALCCVRVRLRAPRAHCFIRALPGPHPHPFPVSLFPGNTTFHVADASPCSGATSIYNSPVAQLHLHSSKAIQLPRSTYQCTSNINIIGLRSAVAHIHNLPAGARLDVNRFGFHGTPAEIHQSRRRRLPCDSPQSNTVTSFRFCNRRLQRSPASPTQGPPRNKHPR